MVEVWSVRVVIGVDGDWGLLDLLRARAETRGTRKKYMQDKKSKKFYSCLIE